MRPARRCLLLLLPVLAACAHKRRESAWPVTDPSDRCFAGHAPGADLPGPKPVASIQPRGLKNQEVGRVFGARAHDMKGCFLAGFNARPGLAGWVQLRFVVGQDGQVLRSEIERSSLHFPQFEACLGRSLCRWRFAPPTTGQVTVSYPMIFTGASPR
jgi:TonB family protein